MKGEAAGGLRADGVAPVEERGAMLASPLGVIAEEEGLYWFEVTLEGAVLTRIPLRVMYQKLQFVPGMPFPPQVG